MAILLSIKHTHMWARTHKFHLCLTVFVCDCFYLHAGGWTSSYDMWNPELCCTWGIFSSGKEEIYDLVPCAFANVFYSITIIFPSMPIFDTLDCCMVFIPEMHPFHRIFLCFCSFVPCYGERVAVFIRKYNAVLSWG